MIAIYLRVSTDEQAKHGYSLDEQNLECQKLAETKGYNAPFQIYRDEGQSGSFRDRPELNRLMTDIHKGIVKVVIMKDPDRLSRNTEQALALQAELDKYDIARHYVTGDDDRSHPMGKFVSNLKASIAELERDIIFTRTMEGKRGKVKKGKVLNSVTPYGYDWDAQNSTYIINEAEAIGVKKMYELYLSRHTTLDIVSKLNAEGIYNRQGKPFIPNHIYRIIANERYCGTLWQFVTQSKRYNQHQSHEVIRPKEEQIAVTIPKIITKETWLIAKKLREDNFHAPKRKLQQDYLLSGILKCGYCNMSMTIRTTEEGYRYYVCAKNRYQFYANDRCVNRPIKANEFEDNVWQKVLELSTKNNGTYIIGDKKNKITDEIDALEKKIADTERKRNNLHKQYVTENSLSDDEFNVANKFSQKELKKLQQALESARSTINIRPVVTLSLDELSAAVTLEQKHGVILRSGLKVKATRNKENQVHITFE
ncbi:MAG: recombinase family protein [Negativicutes bacterium]|nr:recombinase family protein [Negativicutes bacterium]